MDSNNEEEPSSWLGGDIKRAPSMPELTAADAECSASVLRLVSDNVSVHDPSGTVLHLIAEQLADPGLGEAVALELAVHRAAAETRAQAELVKLKIQCRQCICGDGATDECCPVCIPDLNGGDIFQQHAALLAFAKRAKAAQLIGRGSNNEPILRPLAQDPWFKFELQEAERALGYSL